MRRFYEEIDKGNIGVFDEVVAEDYLDHNPPPLPGLASGDGSVVGCHCVPTLAARI